MIWATILYAIKINCNSEEILKRKLKIYLKIVQ